MVNEGPQRPDALLEMDIRFRSFACDRMCVLQRLAQFQLAEKCVAVGAKSFLTRNPNWGARPPRALLNAPRVSRLSNGGLGEASESFDPFGVFRAGALPDSTTHFGFKRASVPLYL